MKFYTNEETAFFLAGAIASLIIPTIKNGNRKAGHTEVPTDLILHVNHLLEPVIHHEIPSAVILYGRIFTRGEFSDIVVLQNKNIEKQFMDAMQNQGKQRHEALGYIFGYSKSAIKQYLKDKSSHYEAPFEELIIIKWNDEKNNPHLKKIAPK